MAGNRIIVADDEPHVLSALAQLLQSAGHTVIGKTTNGEEAVCLSRALDPDIVLLDVQMPGMDGLEAAKRIMSSKPVPIVICTAYYDEDLIGSAIDAGVYAYVVKPCRLADLLPAMNVAISRFRDAKALRGEVDTLKETLSARKLIEQAKGIVMRTRHLSEEEAHRFMQQESQRQSKPLSDLAQAIIIAEKALSSKPQSEGGLAGTVA